MNRIIVIVLLVLAALCSTVVDAQKLQIVVENNVDDCEHRVQNGDLVYTYYTVRLYILNEFDVKSSKIIIFHICFCFLFQKGTFEDGTVFDSNVGAKPYTFTLGAHQVEIFYMHLNLNFVI